MCSNAPLAWDDLPILFPGIERPGRWLPLLQRHAALIAEASPRVRVTAVPPEEAIRRQYAESLELLRLWPEAAHGPALADVGSGGGYPGLVIAAVLPELRVHLVEPLQKRARLLAEIADALGLPNVAVHAARAEEAGWGPLRESCHAVTARAVAELRELLEYTAPLSPLGGTLAFPKGSGLAGEIELAGRALEELSCTVNGVRAMRPEVSPNLSVLVIDRVGPTPERYPRRAGMPGKRPL